MSLNEGLDKTHPSCFASKKCDCLPLSIPPSSLLPASFGSSCSQKRSYTNAAHFDKADDVSPLL